MSKSEERYYTKEYWINDFPSEQISRFNNYIKYFEEWDKKAKARQGTLKEY